MFSYTEKIQHLPWVSFQNILKNKLIERFFYLADVGKFIGSSRGVGKKIQSAQRPGRFLAQNTVFSTAWHDVWEISKID